MGDQANSKTCVLHAIANASVEACMDLNLDLKLDELVGGLKQLELVDIEGNRVEDFNGATLKKLTDFNSRNFYDIHIKIRTQTPEEVQRSLTVQDTGIKFVLVYQDNPTSEPHCVYVKELATFLGKLRYVCINSWGSYNDILLKEVGQVSTLQCSALYEVTVTYEQSKSPRMQESRSTSSEPLLAHYSVLDPPTRNQQNIDSGSSSPIWSFNSSYSSSPSFTGSNGWISMGRDSMDLAPDNPWLHEDSIPQNGSDCPRISGFYI